MLLTCCFIAKSVNLIQYVQACTMLMPLGMFFFTQKVLECYRRGVIEEVL